MNRPPVLRFALKSVRVSAAEIRVDASYSRCLLRTGMNFWHHEVEFAIPRAGDKWVPQPSTIIIYGDGDCRVPGGV